MLTKERIYQLIDTALGYACGYQAKVEVSNSAQGLSRIANSEIHQNVFEEKTTLTVSIYAPQKVSSISTNILSEAGIAEAVNEAISNLELLPDGEPQPALVREPAEIETIRYNQELQDSFDVRTRAQIIAAGLEMIPQPYRAYGQLTQETLSRGIGNSEGIKRYSKANYVIFELLISDDLGGTGRGVQIARMPDEIDGNALFSQVLTKAKANRDPVELEPGTYTVILEPQAVMDLTMQALLFGFSGTMVANKASFLTDLLGEKVVSDQISLYDDWSDPLVAGDAFDGEGTPRQKLTLIEKGIAVNLVHDQLSALRMGTTSTGHALNVYGMSLAAPTNVVMAGGAKTLAEIISTTERALLVSRFHYMNAVNMRQALMTGITRDGFFLIENGKVSRAVSNMRFTESLVMALNKIIAISSDRVNFAEIFGAMSLPALVIADFHFTGKTSFKDAKGV